MKTRVMYCVNCHKDTAHELVDKRSALSGSGFARGILAVCSLGISEVANTATVVKQWECRCCGKIRKD